MDKTISRTLRLYTYPVFSINVVDGNMELTEISPIISDKMLNDHEIKKLTSREYPGIQVYVGDGTYSEKTYKMPLSDFIAFCEKLEENNNKEDEE